MDKKGLLTLSPFSAATVVGGAEYLLLSARKADIAGTSTGEAAAWVGGEDGALTAESEPESEVTEEMEECRGTIGRLERKLCGRASAVGGVPLCTGEE